jgi:hypothetical protein
MKTTNKQIVLIVTILLMSRALFSQCNNFCTSIGTNKFYFSGAADYTSKIWSISGNTGMTIVGSNTGDTVEVSFAAANTGVDTVMLVFSNTCGASPVQKFPVNILKTPSPSLFAKNPTTTCGGSDGSFVLSGLLPNTLYDVFYTKSGVTSNIPTTTNTLGRLTISNLNAGIYTNIYVKLTTTFDCSSAGFTDTIKDPVIPVIASKTKTNPTTCGGSEGTITLKGLSPGVNYTVAYKKGGVSIVSNIVASITGDVVITGLTAGIYDSISVTSAACQSPIANPNPDTLFNPAPPVITSSYKIDPVTCGGTQGAIVLKGLINGNVYKVDYIKNGVPVNVNITAVGDSVVIGGLGQGTYTSITVTYTACVSSPAIGPITLSDPALPVITSNTFTNPTTCGGSEGTITLGGMTNGITYMINYLKDGIADSVNLLASANSVIIVGLKKGIYSNITVTSAACASLPTFTDTLRDPNPPVISAVSDSMTKTCLGADGKIVLSGLNANTTYSVNYIKGTPQGPINIVANAAGDVIISGLTTGVYSNITVTQNNCISNVVGPRTIIGPAPNINSLIIQCK